MKGDGRRPFYPKGDVGEFFNSMFERYYTNIFFLYFILQPSSSSCLGRLVLSAISLFVSSSMWVAKRRGDGCFVSGLGKKEWEGERGWKNKYISLQN